MNQEDLIPPDLNQCQTELSSYNPFIMGGNVYKTERCKNKPAYVVTENEPDEEGIIGSMSVCEQCKPELEKQMSGKITYNEIT